MLRGLKFDKEDPLVDWAGPGFLQDQCVASVVRRSDVYWEFAFE